MLILYLLLIKCFLEASGCLHKTATKTKEFFIRKRLQSTDRHRWILCIYVEKESLKRHAGSNCISRSSVLPDLKNAITTPSEIQVRGADESALGIDIHALVKVGLHQTIGKVSFLVFVTLLVDFLLGTEFIDNQMKEINLLSNAVYLLDSTEAPILRRW